MERPLSIPSASITSLWNSEVLIIALSRNGDIQLVSVWWRRVNAFRMLLTSGFRASIRFEDAQMITTRRSEIRRFCWCWRPRSIVIWSSNRSQARPGRSPFFALDQPSPCTVLTLCPISSATRARQVLVKLSEHWPERGCGPNPVRLAAVLWTPMGTDRRTGRPSLHPLGNRRATEPARACRRRPVCPLWDPDRNAQPSVIRSAYGHHDLPIFRIRPRSHQQQRATDPRSLWTTTSGDGIGNLRGWRGSGLRLVTALREARSRHGAITRQGSIKYLKGQRLVSVAEREGFEPSVELLNPTTV